jgi:hypothetical protein
MSKGKFAYWGLAGLALLVGTSCVPERPPISPADDLGEIELSLTQAPADVRCIQVSVQSPDTARRLFGATPGRPATLTLERVPAGPVTIAEAAFSDECARVGGASRPTWQSDGPVSATVIARQTTSVTIVLRPTGSVRVGTDFQPAPLTAQPASLDFGSVPISGMSRALAVTVRNGTGATTGRIAATIIGASAAEFTVGSNDCGTLANTRTCTVSLLMRPATGGGKSAILQLSASPGGMVTVALVGAALAPASLVIVPSELDFGTVASGDTAGPAQFTIRNLGQTATGDLSDIMDAISTGSIAFRFVSENCAGATLEPGASCTVSVRAAPPIDLDSGLVKTASLTVSGSGGATARALLRLTIF